MTTTIGNNLIAAFTWDRMNTNRTGATYAFPYYDTNSTAVISFVFPERAFIDEFMIEPIKLWDSGITRVNIVLKFAATEVVKHKILSTDTDPDRMSRKVFDVGGIFGVHVDKQVKMTLTMTALGPQPNQSDINWYRFSLWGRWDRETS